MSGHSKWSQIKRQKGMADQKRGQVFSKLTNAIILAARGGGDPNANFALKIAIEKAHLANMPKENIDRAIKRGMGELGGDKMQEVVLEAIGPYGIGILIEAATDNRNRTNSEVKNVLTKFGGKLAGSGAVSYLFNRMSKLTIRKTDQNKEEVEMAIIDSGAQDYQDEDDVFVVYSLPNELEHVKQKLEAGGIEIQEAGLAWEPKNFIKTAQKDSQKVLDLMENLESVEGVTAVYPNFDLSSELEKSSKELI